MAQLGVAGVAVASGSELRPDAWGFGFSFRTASVTARRFRFERQVREAHTARLPPGRLENAGEDAIARFDAAHCDAAEEVATFQLDLRAGSHDRTRLVGALAAADNAVSDAQLRHGFRQRNRAADEVIEVEFQ